MNDATLSRVLEQTAIGVVVTNRGGVIEYVNPAFESITGYTRTMALGQTPRLLRSGVQSKQFYEQLWRTILSGRCFQTVVTNRRRDGRLFEYEQTITPIRARGGSITHFVSTGCDITAQRRRNDERLHQEMEREAMRVAGLLHDEVGQFLALAHMTLADVSRSVTPLLDQRLQEVRRYLDHVEERLRDVSRGMQPRLLADLGLRDAIRFLAKGCERSLGVTVSVAIPQDFHCAGSIETLLYRATQEALLAIGQQRNVTAAAVSIRCEVAGRRASDATVRCSITSARSRSDAHVVADDTTGFASIQRQVEAVGGTLQVAIDAANTEIVVVLPFVGS